MGYRRAVRFGLALSAVLAWGALDLLVAFDPQYPGAPSLAGAAAYAVPGYVLLMARRQWPIHVFVVLLLHSMLGMVVTPGYLPTLDLWVGLFAVAAYAPPSRTVVAALGTSGPLVITEIAQIAQIERHPGTNPLRTVAAGVAFWVVVTAAVTVIGRWVRRNTQEHARAEALAEQAADQAARQAVGAERARIAQDLHDVVSHSLTLMTLQAAMAGRLLESNPVAAARALSGVAELGEQASTELHGLLGLWDDQEVARTGTGHDLIALVERARRAMPNLVLTVRGEPRALATEADEVAYRVVQEALTNAARFGDPAHAVAVTLEWAADAMGVTVDNRMRCGRQERAGAVGGGRGLVGMRQRVRRCGGEFLAQPSGDRRFVVTARLPTVSIPQARRGRTAQTRPASVPSLFS